jgi:hypothetical protein
MASHYLSSVTSRKSLLHISLGLIATMLIPACQISFDPLPNSNSNDNSDDEDRVVVVFRNLTDKAVITDFYLSGTDLQTLPGDLFISANRYTSGIGVGGQGTISPLAEDEIRLGCTTHLALGTTGGRFVDNDSGVELGTGDQQYYYNGPLNLCGREITFEYYEDDEGEFHTEVDIN